VHDPHVARHASTAPHGGHGADVVRPRPTIRPGAVPQAPDTPHRRARRSIASFGPALDRADQPDARSSWGALRSSRWGARRSIASTDLALDRA